MKRLLSSIKNTLVPNKSNIKICINICTTTKPALQMPGTVIAIAIIGRRSYPNIGLKFNTLLEMRLKRI